MAGKPIKILLLILVFFITAGCQDELDERISRLQQQSQSDILKLGEQLDKGQVRNAVILKEYVELLRKQRPELSNVLDVLVIDSTREGPLFKSLQQRVTDANTINNDYSSREEQASELINLTEALNPTLFNDALSDPVNVVADLSQGKLARVNALSQAQSKLANAAEDFGPGSQLVGNPNYGSWVTDNNGMSMWEWFGAYLIFSTIADSISYDRWGRYRGYSYYSDYGRYRYSTHKQRRYQKDTWLKTKKKYSTGTHYSSPYSKSRVGASRLSTNSNQAKTTASRNYAGHKPFRQTRSTSSYSNNSSFRNSRSSTSRGISRGK
ncbi:hypothetical protein [Psychrobium sp. 1_MG-2023]|uniref:hypothetical protein n=1 Tax=Psychrobium sp. 1_MG-2023 TaxID=3062624 RepID=UPI000C33F297|nr:hypothetical protein [Psychrobium sp. 1_MG-2023]MDP2562249.1 hypothetical protein [Psychrobium sp. 1_MG-2023]PKF57499.1 hypothetical protein CW748_06300 [Alteromonadales bacterium alter-6D02]